MAGSSGGAITAITAMMAERGERVVATAPSKANPRTAVPVGILDRDEALAAAGSRYAPVAAGAAVSPATSAAVVKPCEASALRALAEARHEEPPLLISFFCAGTPSQHATDELIAELGIAPSTPLRSLRYRGGGWPGTFLATGQDGRTAETTYEDSWGRVLGPSMQWRCKVCADGVGESADLVAADFWKVDARGYPSFAEGDGVSALIVRTVRGSAVLADAIASGLIAARPLSIADLSAVQPLHRTRRRFLAARLLGSRLGGAPVPRYRGFGLVRLALSSPRTAFRTARGAFDRVRSRRRPA